MPKIELKVTDCTPEQALAITAYIAKLSGSVGHDVNVAQTVAELSQVMATPPAVHTAPPTVPSSATVPNPPAPPSPPQPPVPPVMNQPPSPNVPSTVTSAELDKRGVPYHPDHHAATKGQTKDGAWMRKKGSDKDVVAAYEAQFTHRPAAPNPPAPSVTAPPSPPAAPVVQYPTAAQINAQHAPHLPPQGQTVPPAAPNPPAPPPPPPAPVAQAERFVPTYAEFYKKYMDLLEANLMTGEQATRINAKVGAVTGAEYAENEDMRAAAWLEFVALEIPAAA